MRTCLIIFWFPLALCRLLVANDALTIRVTAERGEDRGQVFGTLFEAVSEDGSLVLGAGFQNAYNTRYRADRHAVQFYVRPADMDRPMDVRELPRPNNLTGTYLFGRDETLYSGVGGVTAWQEDSRRWQLKGDPGGTAESMRVGDGVLEFGESTVAYQGRIILQKPEIGSYQLFFYANGHFCFYHVNRGDGGYRPFSSDRDGFSKLYACPWTPDDPEVDLKRAVVLTLPVVGETTFAWGQLNGQIVTGSNIGGFYVFAEDRWRILKEPDIQVSYQLYSTMSFQERLVMGQYPTGRLFDYDGTTITDLAGWPPVLPGVSASAREAQTTAIYGGELYVGVWPWGELWRYHPDLRRWKFLQRMFPHPESQDTVVHPYDVENRNHDVPNYWGQRVTSLVTCGNRLYLSTSAKAPQKWNPDEFPFLAPDKWKAYGAVFELTTSGHLGANTKWTDGPTLLEFTIQSGEMMISQDGQLLAATKLTGALAEKFRSAPKLQPIRWGDGIYGKFPGPKISGSVAP